MSKKLIVENISTLDLGVKYTGLINKALLSTIAQQSNIDVIDKVVQYIISNPMSTLYFMGVGKNSYLSHKLAATCQSLNIKASYLDAVHFMHGDAGVIRPNDVIIAFSKSGKTSELLHTLKYIKNNKEHFNAYVVSVFAHNDLQCNNSVKDMDIAINSDDQIILRDLKETDNIGTVPTTSALIMQFIGDIIALQIAMSNNLTSEEFGLTHPGGLIGQVHNTAK